MLSPGNRKLGADGRIWTFSLPSRATCPGRSHLCARRCYSYPLERFRPSVARRYRRNLARSRRPDFVRRVVAFARCHRVGVVRIHVGGDFYSAAYARKWLAVARRLPATRFYCYTRSWRVPAIRPVLAALARLPNVRVWFSCDRETGVPARVPRRVRLAWLMAAPEDVPPRADLVFRVRALRGGERRRVALAAGGSAPVCPVEDGTSGRDTTCARCGVCWRPTPPAEPPPGRLPLPMIDDPPPT